MDSMDLERTVIHFGQDDGSMHGIEMGPAPPLRNKKGVLRPF